MLKKLVLTVLVLVALIAGGVYYIWSNFDMLVKVAVEKYGTAATQTTVKLGGVDIALNTGAGTLNEFSMGNPAGFSSGKSISFKKITVDADIESFQGTGPIVIRRVVIQNPVVNYEIAGNGGSNLGTIVQNAKNYAESFGNNKKPKTATPSEPSSEKESRKVIIEELLVEEGEVSISQPALEKVSGKPMLAKLPTIRLTNIGKARGGATAAEVAEQLFGAITKSASQIAAGQLAGKIQDTIEKSVKGAVDEKNVGGTIDQLKGMIGQ